MTINLSLLDELQVCGKRRIKSLVLESREGRKGVPLNNASHHTWRIANDCLWARSLEIEAKSV